MPEMKPMKTVVLASLILASLWHLPLAAQVYKWVDEKGNVHFSDRPQSEDSEQLNLNVTPETGETDSSQSLPGDSQAADTALAQSASNAVTGQATATEPQDQNLPPENLSVPPPMANCAASAENARRILLSSNKPELRSLAANNNFKSRFIENCQQTSGNPQGRAQAVCIQRARNVAEYEACGN